MQSSTSHKTSDECKNCSRALTKHFLHVQHHNCGEFQALKRIKSTQNIQISSSEEASVINVRISLQITVYMRCNTEQSVYLMLSRFCSVRFHSLSEARSVSTSTFVSSSSAVTLRPCLAASSTLETNCFRSVLIS